METQAIILAAGEGKRLRPLTQKVPKCLLEIAGTTILENALKNLSQNGVQQATVIIGHLANVVKQHLKQKFNRMNLDFVINNSYRTTNSMYSLYLGLAKTGENCWIIEGDIFFDDSVVNQNINSEIVWLADSSCHNVNGAYLEVDQNNRAVSLEIIRDIHLIKQKSLKSIGIIHLQGDGIQRVKKWLKEGIHNGMSNEYYDTIISQHLKETHVSVIDMAGSRWVEIDTPEDLHRAQKVFA